MFNGNDRKYIKFFLFSWGGKLCLPWESGCYNVTSMVRETPGPILRGISCYSTTSSYTRIIQTKHIHIKVYTNHTWSLQLNRLAYLTIQPPNYKAHYKYSIGLFRISWWRLKFLALFGERTFFFNRFTTLAHFLLL